MNLQARLTPKELEVAECLAWRASKKEVPDLLPVKPGKRRISLRTVEAITRNIYEKLDIQKVSELCVWYFCSKFSISLDFSPLKRRIVGLILLITIIPAEFNLIRDAFRVNNMRVSTRIRLSGRQGRRDDTYYVFA